MNIFVSLFPEITEQLQDTIGKTTEKNGRCIPLDVAIEKFTMGCPAPANFKVQGISSDYEFPLSDIEKPCPESWNTKFIIFSLYFLLEVKR